MAFTRDDLAAYEKGEATAATAATEQPAAVAAVAAEAEVEDEPAELEGEETLASDSASSAEEETPAQDEPGNDGSTDEEAASSAAADPDSSSTENEPAASASRPKHVPYERFQEVVDERNALRRFGEYLQENRPAATTVAAVTETTAPPVAAAVSKPFPTLEQFDFDPVAHAKAVTEWTDERIAAGVQTALSTQRTQEDVKQIGEAFEARVAEFKKSHLDYDTVIRNPNLPKPSQQMARALVLSENGPAVLHHLATHPDIALRISKKSPEDQAIEVGRISGQLMQSVAPKPVVKAKDGEAGTTTGKKTDAASAAQPARTRTVSQAPPPPRPVSSGTASVTRNPLDPKMSMEEFVKLDRQATINKREQRQKMLSRLR